MTPTAAIRRLLGKRSARPCRSSAVSMSAFVPDVHLQESYNKVGGILIKRGDSASSSIINSVPRAAYFLAKGLSISLHCTPLPAPTCPPFLISRRPSSIQTIVTQLPRQGTCLILRALRPMEMDIARKRRLETNGNYTMHPWRINVPLK